MYSCRFPGAFRCELSFDPSVVWATLIRDVEGEVEVALLSGDINAVIDLESSDDEDGFGLHATWVLETMCTMAVDDSTDEPAGNQIARACDLAVATSTLSIGDSRPRDAAITAAFDRSREALDGAGALATAASIPESERKPYLAKLLHDLLREYNDPSSRDVTLGGDVASRLRYICPLMLADGPASIAKCRELRPIIDFRYNADEQRFERADSEAVNAILEPMLAALTQ